MLKRAKDDRFEWNASFCNLVELSTTFVSVVASNSDLMESAIIIIDIHKFAVYIALFVLLLFRNFFSNRFISTV